jgi:hypothetical protein
MTYMRPFLPAGSSSDKSEDLSDKAKEKVLGKRCAFCGPAVHFPLWILEPFCANAIQPCMRNGLLRPHNRNVQMIDLI